MPVAHPHRRALLSLASFCSRCEVFFKARGVVRSRPYHKNDNPHVEEKNNSVIRKFVGYDRHDTREEVDLLNRLYRSLHLLVNWFLPSQKLLHKVRTGSHITKVYDLAQTPEDFCPIPRGCSCIRGVYSEGCCTICQDADTGADVPEATKQQLRSIRAELDLASLEAPLGLDQHSRGHHEILRCQEQLDEMAKRRQSLVIKKCGSYRYILRELTRSVIADCRFSIISETRKERHNWRDGECSRWNYLTD